ncbi:hypothetical protein T459_19831 [Capsicum annuum]|uniref:Uncharacterized protein n=1 Tax=Capsicum annuum TaxID=4072 RepID=A0A2G2Z2V9_CAPAN|nr:hypothetical protein T459_19831 [Capsicum annuum]
MDDGINAVVLMDYVEFQIFPSHNRSHVCYGNKMETAASGLLEQLIIHSPKIISLHSKGSDVDFRFRPVRNLSDAKWFTKSTLIRCQDAEGLTALTDDEWFDESCKLDQVTQLDTSTDGNDFSLEESSGNGILYEEIKKLEEFRT